MESAEVAASSTFGPTPEMEKFLCDLLLDTAQPIAERFRALFSLRNLHGDGPRCTLLQGLTSLTHPLISMIKLVV
jgi:deoxyhypusine monooxygenase